MGEKERGETRESHRRCAAAVAGFRIEEGEMKGCFMLIILITEWFGLSSGGAWITANLLRTLWVGWSTEIKTFLQLKTI